MATIDSYDFKGKRAIVRVDFNVPLDENGKITDDTRIRGALPTLKKVLADGGSLVIMSHMGKPKGKVNPKFSLSQIVDAVSEKLGVPVKFAPDCAKAAEAAAALKPGEALMLENLRFYPEEEGKPVGIEKEDPAYEEAKKAMKASQKEFAKTLASYADCYINDAFGTAHRKHASTAVIADYFDAGNKMLGYLMEKEVKAVDNILSDIKRPFTAIMGGSKVSTKIGIIENLMDKVDNLILCGGMTFTFAKAQGGKIGNSICEDDKLQLALDIIAKAKAKGVNLVLGTDCVAADAFSNDANTQICPERHPRRLGGHGCRSRIAQGFRRRDRRRQDHSVERPCRRIRVRQVRRRIARDRRSDRQGDGRGRFLAYRRRRLGGMHQQVRHGRSGILHLDRRRRAARSHRGQGTSGRSRYLQKIMRPER